MLAFFFIMRKLLFLLLSTIYIFSACRKTHQIEMQTKEITSPVAEKKDSLLEAHGNTRVDPYFWMRLTDQQKTATDPDIQTIKVVKYLENENYYTNEVMKSTNDLQNKLFNEMTGRIQKDDSYSCWREGDERELLGAVWEFFGAPGAPRNGQRYRDIEV